jgi:hypothetical protein
MQNVYTVTFTSIESFLNIFVIPIVNSFLVTYDNDDHDYSYKNYNERVSQNLYSTRFHTDQPKRQKYKKISMIITYKYYIGIMKRCIHKIFILNMSIHINISVCKCIYTNKRVCKCIYVNQSVCKCIYTFWT